MYLASCQRSIHSSQFSKAPIEVFQCMPHCIRQRCLLLGASGVFVTTVEYPISGHTGCSESTAPPIWLNISQNFVIGPEHLALLTNNFMKALQPMQFGRFIAESCPRLARTIGQEQIPSWNILSRLSSSGRSCTPWRLVVECYCNDACMLSPRDFSLSSCDVRGLKF